MPSKFSMPEIVLSKEASAIFKNIVKYDGLKEQESKRMRQQLIVDQLLDENSNYEYVAQNVRLKKVLKRGYCLGLSEEISSNDYGLGFISQHDLFHNTTKNTISDFLDETGIKYCPNDIERLQTSRSNLQSFLNRGFENFLLLMGLPGTPTPETKKVYLLFPLFKI